jgi:hypothetical protein
MAQQDYKNVYLSVINGWSSNISKEQELSNTKMVVGIDVGRRMGCTQRFKEVNSAH